MEHNFAMELGADAAVLGRVSRIMLLSLRVMALFSHGSQLCAASASGAYLWQCTGHNSADCRKETGFVLR